MNDLLPFAKRMLADHGEFYAFGGTLQANGNIVWSGADVEDLGSSPLVFALEASFRGQAVASVIVSLSRSKTCFPYGARAAPECW